MAVVTNSKRNDGIANSLTGSFTGDGLLQTLVIGFAPTHFQLINETDAITFEKQDPMVAANTLKTIAVGTRTIDASSAIVFNVDGTVSISAATAIAGKAFKFRALR